MDIILLLVLAVSPPVAFLCYIIYMDRAEPEPHNMIAKVLFIGAAAVIPAGLIEYILLKIPFFNTGGFEGAFLQSFIIISPVEELAKLLVVLLFVWNNKNFNEKNDGIVYVGTAAVGFALFENILYVMQHGFSTGFFRSITAIPLHTFTGILMGYFTGIAKFSENKSETRKNILKGFFIAYIVHAMYDTLALSGTSAGLLIIPIVIAIAVMGVSYLKKGREVSVQQWSGREKENAENIPTDDVAAEKPSESKISPVSVPAIEIEDGAKKTGKIKVVISRLIFTACGIFWAMMVIGIAYGDGSSFKPDDAGNIIAGTVVLTIIPVMIGVFLEISHRRDGMRSLVNYGRGR
jgi:RsiW-degrading membrane proteinase PrsW (M82 family)